MIQGIDKLDRELRRVRRPRSAAITPSPDGQFVEVGVGDSVEIVYEGERRRVRVLALVPWGLRCLDLDKQSVRAFRFERIGIGEQTLETDAAASG